MSALSHHIGAIKRAIETERGRSANRKWISEPDFLPAALEVIERPVSPTSRVTSWVLLIGLAMTVAWLVLGHIDIVASAQGKIEPAEDVKLVQAASTGIVRRIYVGDGDQVRKGQSLIDLDPTVSTADREQAAKTLQAAKLDVARSQAVADALSGKGMHFEAPAGTPTDIIEMQRRLIAADVARTQATMSSLAAARASSLADAQAAGDQVRKYHDTLPVLDRELDAMNGLAAKGYAPGMKLMELQRQRRAEAGESEIALAQKARGISDARKFAQQLAQAREEARQTALSELAKAQNEVLLREQEFTKASRRSRLQRLIAPVDGTVQQLAIHTVGGVVEPVRPLLVIVPRGALLAEVRILNRDSGFVRPGQAVAMKLEAFPYTRYGTIPGIIESIDPDAIEDRKLGPVYIARVRLSRTNIDRGDALVPLGSGMAITADIRTGRRNIMSFLISPIRETGSSAGRER